MDMIIELLDKIKEELDGIKDGKVKSMEVVPRLYTKLKETKQKLVTLTEEEMFIEQLKIVAGNILTDFYSRFYSELQVCHGNLIERYEAIIKHLDILCSQLKRIEYLSVIGEKNVILIGGNGIGKSSFASYLKDTVSDNVVVIPAQKILFYNGGLDKIYLADKNEMNVLQEKNYISEGKFSENTPPYQIDIFTRELSGLFSKLITSIVNNQIENEHNLINKVEITEEDKENTILYRLNKLWCDLIPDISFEIDTTNRTLKPMKNGQTYALNSMSDGEKAILYYICHVLLARENSYIIVDEPETFLNVSNFNRLWNNLEEYRPDCKFIYISHVIDFIATRSNADLLWCKKYDYPDVWDIEKIKYDSDLLKEFPKQLLSELLDIRKPILFCEGDKTSLDYFVYTSLFKDKVVVCPVGGHTQVIQYTRAYNNLPILQGNKAFGIIDGDLMDDVYICELKNDRIYALPFNEIEMLFLTEEIIVNVLETVFSSEDVNRKVRKFKEEFFKIVDKEKENIVHQKMKKYLDNILFNYRIKDIQNANKMIDEVMYMVSELNVEELEKQELCKLSKIITEKNYSGMLRLCPQKKEISRGLANRLLDSDFENKAKTRLRKDVKLIRKIRKTYFSDFTF